jgi:hypothetical protein
LPDDEHSHFSSFDKPPPWTDCNPEEKQAEFPLMKNKLMKKR